MLKVLQAIKMWVGDEFAALFLHLSFYSQKTLNFILFSCQTFMWCVKNTICSTSYVTEEPERSGGSFVIYSNNPEVVNIPSPLISEPPISREMGSEHSISDTLFIWVDKEHTLYTQCSHILWPCPNVYISERFSDSVLQTRYYYYTMNMEILHVVTSQKTAIFGRQSV
jgi:hypothetical protein